LLTDRACQDQGLVVGSHQDLVGNLKRQLEGDRLLYTADGYSLTPGTPTYLMGDKIGSTATLMNSAGVITGSYTYDVFGAVRTQTGATTEFSFTGEQNDPNGLEFLRARYYDPSTGRFLSRDRKPGRMTAPLTQNRYAYALDNPVNMTDPSGNDAGYGTGPIVNDNFWGMGGWYGGGGGGGSPGGITSTVVTMSAVAGVGAVVGAIIVVLTSEGIGAAADEPDQNSKAEAATKAASPTGLPSEIHASERAYGHIRDEHFNGDPERSSQFNEGEDIEALIESILENAIASAQNPVGHEWLIVGQADHIVGIDKWTGEATDIYTVVTDADGNLRTAYPGTPTSNGWTEYSPFNR
jgi:RHS repeat-associated protein